MSCGADVDWGRWMHVQKPLIFSNTLIRNPEENYKNTIQ